MAQVDLYTLDNPRRHRRRGHYRRNPSTSRLAGTFMGFIQRGFFSAVGFAGSVAFGKFMPTEVKSNPYLSPAAKVLFAIGINSVRDSIPGGTDVADHLAAGAATAGAMELVLNVGGASLPGREYFPTLPANTGGGRGGGGMLNRPAMRRQMGQGGPAATAGGSGLYRVSAYTPDVKL